ncbi:hypothetical protein K501DRAFT_204286 [Backusella circina FSU 941]|nr:hypothetical protein K501DRAFT_204286 [Backusella circina FSU 941]
MSKRGANANFGANKRKKTKSHFCAKEKGSGNKSSFMITPNISGVLVMCTRGKESRAAKEAIDLFTEYASIVYPDLDSTEKEQQEGEDDEDEDDLEASIAKEVAALKQNKVKSPFIEIPTGTECMVFIRTKEPIEPVKFVHTILTDLSEKKLKKTRFISRYLPVEKTCTSTVDDIENASKTVMEAKFGVKDDQGNIIPKKFAVACRVRNCSRLTRMDVINKLASVAGPSHSVDLNEPDLTVIAEVCQVNTKNKVEQMNNDIFFILIEYLYAFCG